MGYTRYWVRTDKPITDQFVDYAKNVIKQCSNLGIIIRDGYGNNDPVIEEDKIIINGNAETGLEHETFYITNDADELNEWQFCKTACKPYDYAVRMLLIGAKELGLVKEVKDDGEYNGVISVQLPIG